MLVVDTSVAVKWVVPETASAIEGGTDAALALLPQTLIAPDCIMAEFANAMFKKVVAEEIGTDQAVAALEILPDIVNLVAAPPLVPAAFRLSLELKHPVHDCVFLALAIQNNCRLVTADAKFGSRCRQRGSELPVDLLQRAGAA